MSHIYGHKFTSAYGEAISNAGEMTDTGRTWASSLAGLNGHQIADGLRACVESGESWPPSLPEFVAMCGGKTNGANEYGLTYVPEMYRVQSESEVPRLEKKADPEKAKSALDEMREKYLCR